MNEDVVYRQRGYFRPKGDINAIAERLESIKKKFPLGQAPVEAAIDDGRSPDSPLHGEFTWDKDKATHKCHLIEARRLWTCYEAILVRRDKGQTDFESVVASPANVSIFLEDGSRRYVSVSDAMTEKENELQIIRETEAVIRGLVKRLSSLKKLAVPTEAVDHLGKAADALNTAMKGKPAKKAKQNRRQPQPV